MPSETPDLADFTPGNSARYTASDLADPAGLAAVRRDIEALAAQMQQRGIGAPDYYDLMDLHPAQQRVFFIHVPKCGGTSIRKQLVLKNRCAPVPLGHSGPVDQAIAYMAHSYLARSPRGALLRSYLSKEAALDRRQRFLHVYAGYQLLQNPQRMFILGHQKAREMLRFHRPGTDLFFTTVRAPAEILKSMVAYRVSHTLLDEQRQDSKILLRQLQMSFGEFTDRVRSDPQSLARTILERDCPSLAAFLSFDPALDHAAVIQGLKDNRVFIAHMSEQHTMLNALFGPQAAKLHENTSHNRSGLAAEFTAAVELDWVAPYVDAQSTRLYRQLESSGIIGYWKEGSSTEGYLDLLRNL
ncbi:MAG: hypothetical protein KDI17_06425 [Halioglobus sp.]|nr:hypothetical protein [Halioglobus sp.]